MVASSYVQTPVQLGVLRFITGLGIGGILASSYVIAGEYASKRWRSLAISLQATAYALGATVGGLITAKIIALTGWETVFLYGGVITLLTLPLLYVWLPESLFFHLNRRSATRCRVSTASCKSCIFRRSPPCQLQLAALKALWAIA